MSARDKQRAVSATSASMPATTTADVAAAAGRSRLESLLFDSQAADCSDCTNPNCAGADRPLRLQAETDASSLSASSSVSSSAPVAAAAPGPSKKCSQCNRDRPESSFSNAQLKLKGRRQCRDCIDPICTVCGKGDSARASGAPAPCPAASTLRPLLVKRPRPAADFVITSHYLCAQMLSGRINQNASPTAIAGVPAGLCAILASRCSHCDRDGGALQCGGCSRIYHGACGGALKFANPNEGTIYPSNMRGCPHCTSQRAPLPASAPVCAACGFTDGGFEIVTEWTRNWNCLQSVRVEIKPAGLLLPMHIGCAQRLTDLNSAQLVMPPADSSDAPLLKNLSEHLQSTISGACACCHKPGGTTRCSGCSSRFHHLCLGMQLNRFDEAFATAPMSSCPVCTQLHQTIDRPSSEAAFRAVEALAGAAITGASSAAAATSFPSSSSAASSSSPAAIPAGSKKCAQCQQHLPESGYSASQLKAKGKRQCKSCVAEAQSLQALSPADAEAKILQSRLAALTPRLFSPLESEQIDALCALTFLVKELHDTSAAVSIDARVMTRLMELTAGSSSGKFCALWFGCTATMAINPGSQSQFLSALADSASAIPFMVSTMQKPQMVDGVHRLCLQMLAHIAKSSRSYCDKLMAANALAALLPLVRADSDSERRENLFCILALLLQGRTAAETAAAVTHLGTMITADGAAPPELLCACINALGDVIVDFANGDPNLDSCVEAILAAAPGVPQRLVELLGDSETPAVSDAVEALMISMFKADTDQLRQLFDCGLVNKLLPRLSGTGEKQTQIHAMNLCSNAAGTKVNALTLIDSDPVVHRAMALLADSDGEMLRYTATFFSNAMSHCDRHITRRLVDEFRFLPPLVAAFRRAVQLVDQTSILWCLAIFAHVLIVGDAEAEDDDRGVNPYIEPIDWLGAFEIVDPLQKHSDAQLADVATRVFGYFIPNDCD